LTQKALDQFRKLVKEYPASRYATDGLAKIDICRGRLALIEVVGRDPELLLGEPAAADVDLREAVGGVSTRRVLLDEFSELVQGLLRQPLVLLHGLQLVVVAHGEPELDEIGDLVMGKEGQKPFELAHRLVEL